ncbi:hypothetical protein [Bradyrhizobium cajani]|uniref:hypothetical protein n=1 Tax=Bradyrhizobium cajani TaxID=1928661 RepID=UPI00142F01EB|nr:hypothetical protein [Bradyrhizobium cajani]MCP3370155.1 hypothetical protein [Bradyrhizobium cajani]
MPHPLDSFFAPASIALIGASRNHEKIPGIELNPVLVHAEGQGVTIVDALVVGRK